MKLKFMDTEYLLKIKMQIVEIPVQLELTLGKELVIILAFKLILVLKKIVTLIQLKMVITV